MPAKAPRQAQVRARSKVKVRGQWDRLFLAYFRLAEQKKAGAPPGAHPGRQRVQHPNETIKSIAISARQTSA